VLSAANTNYRFDQKRLPSRRPRVTFVIGIKCMDGLVMAADTLEGDTVVKRYPNKLEQEQKIGWGALWGGSGHARVADKFSEKFKQSLQRVGHYDRDKIVDKMESVLRFISERYRPEDGIEVVMALYGPRKKLPGLEWNLYKGDSRSICTSIQKYYSCAGTGDSSLANFILGSAHRWDHKVADCEKLAVWTSLLMKKYADGVGGQTIVFTLLNNPKRSQWTPLMPDYIKIIESSLTIEETEGVIKRYWNEKREA